MNKRYETIRRVIITYPKEEAKEEGNKAIDWCEHNGYRITYMGFTRRKDKRKIIAEKVIE